MGLFSFLTQEIAIDLGTANTIIIHNDKVVVDEPSIVAIDKNTGKLIAIGEKARQMHGKTHENIKTIRPLRDGVIADFNAAELMIRGMIKMINNLVFSPLHLKWLFVYLPAAPRLKYVPYATPQNMLADATFI
jgi:rod shape-determining protein MreB